MTPKKTDDCKWKDSCDCGSGKTSYCEKCRWYYRFDSSFGFCKALPEPTLVAWCKYVCSLYQTRPSKE